MSVYALALGIGTKSASGELLEVYYPAPQFNPKGDWVQKVLEYIGSSETAVHEIRLEKAKLITEMIPGHPSFEDTTKTLLLTVLKDDSAPSNTAEAYLKLHLLSHRLVKPNGTNVSGIFRTLPNNAWTNEGVIALDELPKRQLQARLKGKHLSIESIDKFPKMTDYVVPTGVRIAHSARVRLGAYVGEGSSIMHEGFINFNAGCAGPNMVEGRISAGVMVDSGTDLGGGCSTMGTLSGGNNIVISIGKNCLLGANSGCGIPLGDNCTIEAGLYITGGSKVRVLDKSGKIVNTVKAASLSGMNDLLFRRNSLEGSIECLPLKTAVVLNDELHVNN